MTFNFNNDSPIYVQLANKLEELICDGTFKAGERMPSQVDLGKLININPATAGKSLTLLLERGVAVKRLGLGMFVAENAVDIVKKRRTSGTLIKLAQNYLHEGATLGVDLDRLIEILKEQHDTEAR